MISLREIKMVEINTIRDYMQKRAEEDRNLKSIQVKGENLEEALANAATELGIPVKKIEYDVIVPGRKGLFGVSKRNWVINAYEAIADQSEELPDDMLEDMEIIEKMAPMEESAAGEAIVRVFSQGVFLKVFPPVGDAPAAGVDEVFEILSMRGISGYDREMINKAINKKSANYVKIADIDYNPANDALMNIDISGDKMEASISAREPGPGGADISVDDIIGFAKNNGVYFGFLRDKIEDFEHHPRYGQDILIAKGQQPVNGKDAKIIYNFEVDVGKVHLEEKNGRIDFKELNLIHNVVEGQTLATKTDPEKGKPGKTVMGDVLPAKDGRDINFDLGNNVTISPDGKKVVATSSGQVLLLNGKITVETIKVINGDVNPRTGNIRFLGTVIVKGNVEDGYAVQAQGNIEVMGNVGKAHIEANGDILIHQGINGAEEGFIKTGRNLWAKFIQNAKVEAKQFVIVSDGVMNSYIDSESKILCQGKRANIVGGHLRAAEEINARNLGSPNGVETILECGYDPSSRERYEELKKKLEDLEEQFEEKDLNRNTLEKTKRVRKKLPKDREEALKQLQEECLQLQLEIDEVKAELEELKKYLNSLKSVGKISASGVVHTGVKIIIRDAEENVSREYKASTFVCEAGKIRVKKYEEITDDLARSS